MVENLPWVKQIWLSETCLSSESSWGDWEDGCESKETEFSVMEKIFRTDWRGPSWVTPGKHCRRNVDIICVSWLIDHWASISHDSMVPLTRFSFVLWRNTDLTWYLSVYTLRLTVEDSPVHFLCFLPHALQFQFLFFFFFNIFWLTSLTLLSPAQFSLVFLKILNHET